MQTISRQLLPYSDVLCRMGTISQEHRPLQWDRQPPQQFVAMPAPHDGLRRALMGSFGSIPAMPEEFLKLIDKIR